MALMQLGQAKNGLAEPGFHPWHIRGTYRSYDKHGKVNYQGTYEEWWFSPTKYKKVSSSPHFTQTDYGTGTALLREGDQEWPTGPETLLRESLVDPLPGQQVLGEFELKSESAKVGTGDLDCVSLTYRTPGIFPVLSSVFPTACFEPAQPILRMFSNGRSSETLYNNVVLFKGQYVARQLQVYSSGKLFADLNIDTFEPLETEPESILSPPQEAKPVDLTQITVKEGDTKWPPLFMKVAPYYPEMAKSLRVQGTVDIEAAIDVDGHVSDVHVIDGPPALRQASVDAVKRWLYRPFNVMGAPHPIKMTLHVIYQLG